MKYFLLFFQMLVICTLNSSFAQTVGGTSGLNEKLNIKKVFDPNVVGAQPVEFVNPIAACKSIWSGRTIDGGEIDCHTFDMGSHSYEANLSRQEPLHRVYLTKEFEIQTTEVTQLQWLLVMKNSDTPNPSQFRFTCGDGSAATYQIQNSNKQIVKVDLCKNHPVESVKFEDITGPNGFLERLNASQNKYDYRLPTEAEWEYSTRGASLSWNGVSLPYWFGPSSHSKTHYDWTAFDSKKRTWPVATRVHNPYGLYNTVGNVSEWVSDFHDNNYGLTSKELEEVTMDPQGPTKGALRVVRGGSFFSGQFEMRSAYRFGGGWASSSIGFRLVRTLRVR